MEEHLFEPYFAFLEKYLEESLYLKIKKHFEEYVATIS